MSSPYAMFKTDEELEKSEGIILNYGDFRIRILRAGGANKRFGKLLQAKLKPYRRQLDAEIMDESIGDAIVRDVFVETCVLDMEVKKEDGTYESGILLNDEVVPYNKKNAIDVFTNYPELFDDVYEQSRKISVFRRVQVEEDLKN